MGGVRFDQSADYAIGAAGRAGIEGLQPGAHGLDHFGRPRKTGQISAVRRQALRPIRIEEQQHPYPRLALAADHRIGDQTLKGRNQRQTKGARRDEGPALKFEVFDEPPVEDEALHDVVWIGQPRRIAQPVIAFFIKIERDHAPLGVAIAGGDLRPPDPDFQLFPLRGELDRGAGRG